MKNDELMATGNAERDRDDELFEVCRNLNSEPHTADKWDTDNLGCHNGHGADAGSVGSNDSGYGADAGDCSDGGDFDDDSRGGARLEPAVRKAYESMTPTPEQEARMLSAIMAARDVAGGREPEGGDLGGKATGATAQSKRGDNPASKRGRYRNVWKAAVPLAACLVLGAVIVGVANTPAADNGAPEMLETVTASQSPEAGKAATEEDQPVSSDPRAEEPMAATSESEEDGAFIMSVDEMADADAPMMAPSASVAEDGALVGGEFAGSSTYGDSDFNTEEYATIKETGFVSTKTNPLSTVSADVDTASYCNLRRMINEGYGLDDIPSGAVRIEEMLNYFDYDYAMPANASGNLFSMQAQSAACPWNEDTQLLVLGFAAGNEAQATQKGSNLVFLIDVSGSMDEPDKLDLLQDSFATLLDSLGPNDRVSIVTYASGEDIVLEGASGDDAKAILKAIYKLRAEGATNGEAGLKQAYEVAERNFVKGGVNRIVMASDGDLNVGMASESDLYDFVDAKRESGIYLSVLGFGAGNYKDNKMETLADHGNGSYHYIDCIEEAERVLKEKLTANLVPFADDVKVQVEFNPAQVKAYRLIGYENRELADEDFRDDSVDAGDVGPGAQFTVAYEVVLADSKMKVGESQLKYSAEAQPYGNASGDWLTCTMRYHVFDGDEMREQELVVDAGDVTARPDANWNLAAAVVEFGMLARDSEYAGTSSEDGILDLLASAADGDQEASFKKLVLTAMK